MDVSQNVMRRLPIYLKYLKQLPPEHKNISSKTVAENVGLGEVLVRKDLSLVSGAGRPKTGYDINGLINSLETFLGYKSENTAVLIGAGKLGNALLDYKGFCDYGLKIIAAFDSDLNKIGVSESGKYIYPITDFEEFNRQIHAKIGIITVPAKEAQSVCDLMCKSGIQAIWNFAPVSLSAAEGVLVQNENMAASLALLSSHLTK